VRLMSDAFTMGTNNHHNHFKQSGKTWENVLC